MLSEIICSRFRIPRIVFSQGLNIIAGNGENSIGKSTLLLIIDFVFGGNDFINKNRITIQTIGDHDFQFSFVFGEKQLWFSRGTKFPKDVYICDAKYNVQKTISLDEYKTLLRERYISNLNNISFRELVSTFSRVWGKGNDEITFELKPLQVHSSDSATDCLVRLVKIFNRYNELNSLIVDKEINGNKLKAIRRLFGTDFLPPSIKKGQYEENQECIKKIGEEISDIKRDLAVFSVSIRDIIDKEIAQLKEEKDSLFNYRLPLVNKQKRLQESLTSDRNFKTKGISELQIILPSIDAERLSQVELFHNSLLHILGKNIRHELKMINEELHEVDSRIAEINNTISEKLKSTDMPTTLVDRVYGLATNYSKRKSENDLYDKEHELSAAVKALSKNIDDTMIKVLTEITNQINAKIYKLCHLIYGVNYISPVLRVMNARNYSYSNQENTGAGAT